MDSPTKKKLVEQVVGSVLGEDSNETTDSGEGSFTLEEISKMEKDAQAVLGGSDADNCSYKDGYVKRQAIYACLSCQKDESDFAGMCLACSLKCHGDCELIELYTKRNFRCDCGNGKYHRKCEIETIKNETNEKNVYNHNFKGLYCSCSRPYPDPDCPVELEDDEMIQCVLCEDWWHGTHLELTKDQLENELNEELICSKCLKNEKNKFLRNYSNANTCTEPVSAECKMPKEDLTNQSGGSFFSESFRTDLCKCVTCLPKMDHIPFIHDESDTISSYESTSIAESEETEQQSDRQINQFMNNLDHRGQIEVAHGISFLKSAMAQMVEAAGESGEGVVTEEHVAVFKRKIQEDIENRKRRRLEKENHF